MPGPAAGSVVSRRNVHAAHIVSGMTTNNRSSSRRRGTAPGRSESGADRREPRLLDCIGARRVYTTVPGQLSELDSASGEFHVLFLFVALGQREFDRRRNELLEKRRVVHGILIDIRQRADVVLAR